MIETDAAELKKIGGILVQRQGDHVVIGIGLNTDLEVDELPTEAAISLSLLGIQTSRETLIAALLVELEKVTKLTSEDWLPVYINDSSTIGTKVSVARKSESIVTGIAVAVLKSGELLLDTEHGQIEITSGDVLQVRPTLP
jgi:BirA family biotin operon repressor/biotin-[acetyl-CoA-carboxylase] ligase